MELGPGQPTPPIPLSGGAGSATSRFTSSLIAVSDEVVTRLGSVCKIVTTSAAELAEASRDWWPLAMIWALDSQTAALASVVCRPSTDDEVAEIRFYADNYVAYRLDYLAEAAGRAERP